MRTAHTPGPWTIEEYGDDETPALIIHRDSETRVCFMASPGSHGDPAKIEADARLIAAAPELYAAGKAVLAGLNARIERAAEADAPHLVFDGIAALHAALAKASADEKIPWQ